MSEAKRSPAEMARMLLLARSWPQDQLRPLAESHGDLLEALNAIMSGFVDGSIRFTKKRQSDSDPHHPANILMCAAIAKAEGRE